MKQDEFVAETVLDHRFVDGTLEFFVKWVGHPLADKTDPDSWFTYYECRFCPPVRTDIAEHNLSPKADPPP